MIYVIVGPTCSGKTGVAKSISSFFNCPIINADAFQIYKDMNIGTAKITSDDPCYKKHYLLDIMTPDQSFSVKEYQDIFRKTLDELLKENKNIVICGGTGLYIKAGLYDFQFEEFQDDTSDLEKLSNDELWNILLELDPASCHNLHKNNRKRVIRAISIARTNKLTKSENISSQTGSLIYDNVRFLFLNPDRDSLYKNINERVDLMIEEGLVEEVKGLLEKYDLSLTSKQAIGYKEIIGYLNGEYDLTSAIELIKKRTRNYAKRQVTYFKHQFNCDEFKTKDDLLKEVIKPL